MGYEHLTFSEMMASLCPEILMRLSSTEHHAESMLSPRARMEELALLERGGMSVCTHIYG